MNETRTIQVHTEVDVITARMQVRDLARSVGMNLADQARISLATSSAAHAMGLGGTREGRITMSGLRNGDRTGVQVVCIQENGADHGLTLEALGETRWMVDDLSLETLPPNDLQITLVKWRG